VNAVDAGWPILGTSCDVRSDAFHLNAAAMADLVTELRRTLASTAVGGPASVRQRHVARSKLLPRARVEQLLDPGSAFLELSPLAAHGMYGGDAPAASVITGTTSLCVSS
jgi:3-methylcrotonyl-CoA carboxylase beta subunit